MKKETLQLSFNVKELLKELRSSMPLTKAILLAIFIAYREHYKEKADSQAIDILYNEFEGVDVNTIAKIYWSELADADYNRLMKNLFEQYNEAQNSIVSQPHKLIELLGYLCRNSKGTLYYPYCGVSELTPEVFMSEAETTLEGVPDKIFFTDPNPLHVALTRIWNSLFEWRSQNVTTDCFFTSNYSSSCFDTIFLLTPFGLNASAQSVKLPHTLPLNDTQGQLIALYKALSQLTPNGHLYTVLPSSFCSDLDLGVADMRQWLFNRRLVRRIITLPAKLYGNQAPAHTILLELTSSSNETIQWVDASECVLSTLFVKDRILLDVPAVKALLESDSVQSRTTSYPTLTRKDSVNPASVLLTFPDPESGFRWCALEEIAVRIGTRGSHFPFSIVRQSDLATDFFNSEIIDTSLSTQYENCERYPLVTERCLVVATSGEEMHPSILNATEKSPILLSNNLAAFRIRSEIPLEYVCYALSLPFSRRQFLVMSADSSIQHISIENLLRLKIQIPDSLEEQDALARMRDCYLTASDKAQKERLRQMGIAYEMLQSQEFDQYKKEMHSRKHAVIQVLRKFSDTLDVIDIARDAAGGNLSDEFVVNRKTQATVANAFSELDGYMHQLNTMMEKFCDDTLSYGKPEQFSLGTFLNEYIEQHRSVKFRFEPLLNSDFFAQSELTIDGEVVVNIGDSLADVLFPQAALTQVLDNIISNAVEYGFFGRRPELNTIRFRLSLSGRQIILTVENNGHCLAENTDAERIFKFGESSKLLQNGHTGQGLSQVRSLMREFKGDAIALSDPDSDFPFAVKLIFNRTSLVSNN